MTEQIKTNSSAEQGLQIINEVKKAIVGKDEVIRKVLMVILAGGHILLEDVPGVGKTTLARAFAKSMGLDCKRIQFTPDTMASDITGFSVYQKNSQTLEFKKGVVFCHLLLADEINRTSSKTQAALLEVMEEQRVTMDGVSYDLPDPFICIATQNPLGSAGTQNLPDSQLDRFMARLQMGYPSLENQVEIIKARQTTDPIHQVQAVARAEQILALRQAAAQVNITDEMIAYCVRLCEATRSHELIAQGVSPRAILALVQMAKASAFLAGRDYVVPDDIKDIFVDVCAHRIILQPHARIQKTSAQAILGELLQQVKAPSFSAS